MRTIDLLMAFSFLGEAAITLVRSTILTHKVKEYLKILIQDTLTKVLGPRVSRMAKAQKYIAMEIGMREPWFMGLSLETERTLFPMGTYMKGPFIITKAMDMVN